MSKFDRIRYIMNLENEKAKLVKQILKINSNIKEQRSSCSHIGVDLGHYDLINNSTSKKCYCLLCGEIEDDEYYYESKYMVHASKYLPQYDIKDDIQCTRKLDDIRILTLGILRENPDMSKEELVSRLNDLIENSIAKSQQMDKNSGPKLVKK